MSTLITVLHIITCLFLMLTVLLQSGKGGGMGAAFGGGNAATVFGGSGASGFLKRMTAIAGSVFMITSMVLAFLSSRNATDALDKFGDEQEQLAKRKEDARNALLKQKKLNQGSGSAGSGMTPLTPGSGMTPLTPGSGAVTPPPTGSAAPGSGSAVVEQPLTPLTPAGSATTPTPAGSAAKPATPPTGSAAKPPAGSGSAAPKP